LLLSILYLALKEGRQRKEIASKKEVRYFTLGIIVFLLAFSSGNIIGSLTEDWDLAQYGLFGMPIFLGFLTYTVVRYKAFNIKLVGAQALVVSLALLIGAQFFFIQNTTNEILNGITLILGIVFGVLLVKSVKKEIEAKELIQIQRDQLEKANTRLLELDKQKTEFVSFATHQLRSPLTAIRGNASLILEGDLGPISGPLRDVVQTIATSIKTMINVVEDYLNISRLELGTMKYDMQTMDFKDLVKEVVNEQGQNIKAKGLAWTLSLDDSRIYPIKADPDKFKQVVMNIIDNSIKYTSQGSLAFSLIGVEGGFRFGVSDTGVGIDPAVMPKLFQKFTRAPKAHEANIHGTGLGLYIAKEIVAAHGGKIWAESSGEGKGSQFYVEMPEAK